MPNPGISLQNKQSMHWFWQIYAKSKVMENVSLQLIYIPTTTFKLCCSDGEVCAEARFFCVTDFDLKPQLKTSFIVVKTKKSLYKPLW